MNYDDEGITIAKMIILCCVIILSGITGYELGAGLAETIHTKAEICRGWLG